MAHGAVAAGKMKTINERNGFSILGEIQAKCEQLMPKVMFYSCWKGVYIEVWSFLHPKQLLH